ncbi:MAG: hypothetical protein ABI772_09340 [Bacteroidota bacterium]
MQVGNAFYITGKNNNNKGVLLSSVNNGETWNVVNDNFGSGLNSVCTFKNKLFAAGDHFKLYISDSLGILWNEVWIQGTISMEYVTDIRSVCTGGNKLYMCGGNDFGRGFIGTSTDFGNHWIFFQTDHEMRSVAFSDENNGVCVGYGAIYNTNDGGITWHSQNAMSQFWTSVHYLHDRFYTCSYSGGFMQSATNGKSWDELIKPGSFWTGGNKLNCFAGTLPSTIIAAGASSNSILSENFGIKFKNIIFAQENQINDIRIDSNRDGIFVGDNGCIFLFNF